jgi:endonuclease YncB( thermonuclease family)
VRTFSCFVLAGLFVLLGATVDRWFVLAADPPPQGISTTAQITEWYDGDTAKATLTLRVRVRLLDCWAPEVRGRERELGLKSKDHVLELCPDGSKVRLFIPTTGRLQDSLTFGRVLAHAWVEGEDGKWTNISEQMVLDGFATKEKVR